jgi:transcriptional regulator with XRE-family HTH domain
MPQSAEISSAEPAGNEIRTEQARFSDRLNQALAAANYRPAGASLIAREFNLRFPDMAVTVHAVRKWIKGEAIPTQDKLVALSQWLGVKADWLRYDGDGDAPSGEPKSQHFSGEDLRMLRDFQRLGSARKRIVDELIQVLLRSM